MSHKLAWYQLAVLTQKKVVVVFLCNIILEVDRIEFFIRIVIMR